MIDYIISAFLNTNKCRHPNIYPGANIEYCPDCGQRITINWYVTRCGNCNSKRESKISNGAISPMQKHCSKCGEEHYSVEKIEKIEFFDINYAILAKEPVEEFFTINAKTQVWEEQSTWSKNNIKPKMLTAFN